MTENINQHPQDNNLQHKKGSKRRKALALFFFLLILSAVAVTAYWFMFLKGYEETEDAYVAGNQMMVSSQLNGSIKQINVDNMDFVRAGDVLIELDNSDYQIAFQQAQQQLASAVRQIQQFSHNVKQLSALVEAKTIAFNRAKGDLQRREGLAASKAIDKESLQHAREAVAAAKADLNATEHQLQANQALLKDSPLKAQPDVQKAIATVQQAWLNLQRTKIVSAVDGYVARRSAQVGQKVAVGSPLLAVVPNDDFWVEANFKETQLKNMRIGQPVTLHFDLYGKDPRFDGTVAGIEMGTGSAFSLLPAQNATGNWIKVVQRVPVRIALDPEQVKQYPLRIGLSSTVQVNVKKTDGEVLKSARNVPFARTHALDYDFTPVNQLIEQIIQENSN